jgi:cytochrome c biogenesis protein CcmG, thiol:disulfide interchange protein DsbE
VAGRLKLGAQALAVVLVAALLMLLVWKLVDQRGVNAAAGLEQGKTPAAPNFTLERIDRKGELSLSSFRGRAVVLNFWASWCIPCREEAPVLEDAWRRHRRRGLVVLGVDVQDFARDARRFARRYGMTYPLVRDGPGKTMTSYGVTGVPETLFVNRRGKLVGGRLQGGVHLDDNRAKFERYIALALES